MAAYVDHPYYGWSHEELPHQSDSQEVSAAQMLDHGSISFGRFACESLSWEKRSVFTFNKCQEELEKFKSPGLVAKKKAYFEEYYKKIRAMKALEGSQQTEITLDYSGDGSNTSQTGEEEEEEAPIGTEEAENCSEKAKVQIGHTDSDSDSFNKNFVLNEQHDEMIDTDQKSMDIDISVNQSLNVNTEKPEQHDISDVEDKEVSKNNNIPVTKVEPEVASRETKCVGKINLGIVEHKSAQKKMMTRKASVEKTNLGNVVHNSGQKKMVSQKVTPTDRKHKVHASATKLKEPSGPERNSLKLENKDKSNTEKTSNGLKTALKIITKSGNRVDSSKVITDKVSRNNRSSTVPHPFSLANDRRATNNSEGGTRELISMASNRRPSSAVDGKDSINVQGTLKRTVRSSSMKSKEIEKRRVSEEKKKPVSTKVENSSSSLKERGDNVLVSVKARSSSLPPRDKFKSDRNRHEEARHETKATGIRQASADTKKIAIPSARQRTETTKIAPSWLSNSTTGRRPQLDEKKQPRQEKPRWR